MRIDAHQHFWLYKPERDSWITENMKALQRNFLPNDIAQILKDNAIDGVVAVQADQSIEETRFLIELSSVYKLIKGIVGWVDLQSEMVEEEVSQILAYPIVKGFRHIVESEVDPDFLIRPAFQKGLSVLTKYGYTFDLLIRPKHYAATLQCVAANPNQLFMLDHIAKPPIRSQAFDDWAFFIHELSAFPNVYCKVSGLATEADWTGWRLDHFTQYIDHVIACFGKDRVCFGSDWPVCLLAASYEESMQIVQDKLVDFDESELTAFWGGTASRFYKLT